MLLKITKGSGILSKLSADVFGQQGELLYRIREETDDSSWRKLLRLTKWRMALSLEISITEANSETVWSIKRDAVIRRESYLLKTQDGGTVFSFVPGRFMWRSLTRKWEIRNSYDEKIGTYLSGPPSILGPLEGKVMNIWGGEISTFKWERPSFFRTPRDCVVSLNNADEASVIISVTAAIIRAIQFEQR